MARATLRNGTFDPTALGLAGGRVTVSIWQAAARCQVARRTIYAWLATGKVQYVRTAGGKVRIFEDTLFTSDPPIAPVEP